MDFSAVLEYKLSRAVKRSVAGLEIKDGGWNHVSLTVISVVLA